MESKKPSVEQNIIAHIPALLKACKQALPQIRSKYAARPMIKEMTEIMMLLKSLPKN